ncbi:hypothetical protein [Fodinibius halophilus]|uniref:Sulfotransferase domain-containing protein n=1 Tax=Fodinibius halophilus TaxID=1736908 RepID=A0A6M1T2A3_9BACT|nr:hypothetical protein [Fodinibius halophilus]NGP87355.1 hypothetical protein [Fodinibius halophilus]
MKKLHLHIGSYKTGTTSIQDTLFQNRDTLNQLGYDYPGGEVNHHFSFFATQAPVEDWPRQFKSLDGNKLRSQIANYVSVLENDFNAEYEEQIVSTEYLFISNKDYVRSYIDYLSRFFDEIVVYVFIRKPYDFYRSGQQQMIKARSYLTSPQKFRYQFREVIEVWGSFCDVEVIGYERGKDSSKILCDKIGINYDQLTVPQEKSNVSLSLEQMLLLEKIQKMLYQNQENKFKSHLDLLHHVNPPFVNKAELQPEVKALIQKNHRENLKWLEDKYGVNLLDDNIDTSATAKMPVYDNERVSVREVFDIKDEKLVERYEALVIDVVLKKIVKDHN